MRRVCLKIWEQQDNPLFNCFGRSMVIGKTGYIFNANGVNSWFKRVVRLHFPFVSLVVKNIR